MPRIVHKSIYRSNRKRVFDNGDLVLWLDSTGGTKHPRAKFELQRRLPGTRSKTDVLWVGTVTIDSFGVDVENEKVPATNQAGKSK